MQVEIIGKIKVIGKKEYCANGRKVYPGKMMHKIGVLIEMEDGSAICVYFPLYFSKADHTKMVDGLEVGDRVLANVEINSRPWQYTFITNIIGIGIEKID